MFEKIKDYICENILIWPFLIFFNVLTFILRLYNECKIKIFRKLKIKHIIHKDKFYEFATRIK